MLGFCHNTEPIGQLSYSVMTRYSYISLAYHELDRVLELGLLASVP